MYVHKAGKKNISFKSFIDFVTFQVQLHAENPFIHYPSGDRYKILTYAQVDEITTKLACQWASCIQGNDVVSLIADHNVDYLLIILAFLKLRTTLFVISPRSSVSSISEMLDKTGSRLVFVSENYEAEAKEITKNSSGVHFKVVKKFDIEELLKKPNASLDLKVEEQDLLKPVIIIHSSGTTGSPKPVPLSSRALLCYPGFFALNLKEKANSSSVFLGYIPLYHVFCICVTFNVISVGGSVVFMKKLPASQAELYQAISENKVTILGAPPIILEQIISYMEQQKKDSTSALEKLKYIIYGGAPLTTEASSWFKSRGVKAVSAYGSSEMGSLMVANFDLDSDNDSSLRPYLKDEYGKLYGCFEVLDPRDPDIFHFYTRAGYPGLANVESDRPDGGYSSNDLFRKDPANPGYYQYVGRRDDTLVMKNGEKTNPIPMEATLRQSDIIKQAVIIAHGRDCTCALIELDSDFASDYSPEEQFRIVLKAVKQVNKECPNFSILFPPMVKILPPNNTIPTTDKGTVKRKLSETMYSDIVEQLYKNFLESSDATSKNITTTMTREQTKDFLIASVAQVLKIDATSLDAGRSVFDYGLNSVTAIQLRNIISERFEHVPQTFLYQNTSIQSMTDTLLIHGDEQETIGRKRVRQTEDLANHYIKRAKLDFVTPSAETTSTTTTTTNIESIVVLLTGATGSLGSFILQQLLQNKRVKKVYCCIRGPEELLYQRLVDTFQSRSLDVSLLKDRVEVLPMKFNAPFLGLSKARYDQLQQEVTVIQHCAWLLDFNMPVDHFDKECIAPFYNLIMFANREKAPPIDVHFISSVAASAAWAHGEVVPEKPLPMDANVALPMGYAQSKFIVEMLLNYLRTEKHFPCYIERLGQVCGDSVRGAWNISENYPLMCVGGAAIMHKMPLLEDTVLDWIPLDYAARTIVDIMLHTAKNKQQQYVYHVVNPTVFMWESLLDAMRYAGMSFDVIPPSEWVDLLAQDTTNPAYTLIGFFQGRFASGKAEYHKMPVWATEETAKIAPVIHQSPVVDGDLFAKFLKHWQSVGFYTKGGELNKTL